MTRPVDMKDWTFYKDFFDNSSELIHCLDEQGRFLRVNQAWKKVLGYNENELTKMTLWDLLRPDTLPLHRKRFKEVVQGTVYLKNYLILRTKNGDYIELEGSSRSAFDESGKFLNTQGIFRDVSLDKMQQREQEETLTRFQALLEQSPSGISLFDDRGRYLEVSNSVLSLIGLPRDEIIGRSFHQLMPQNLSERMDNMMDQLKYHEEPIVEQVTYAIQGKETVFENRVFRISSDKQGGWIFGSIINDISIQREMEEALYREKEQLRTTLMSVGDGIISTDENGVVQMMNPVAELLTGWSMEEAKGRTLEEIFPIVDIQGQPLEESPARKVLRTGQTATLEDHTVLLAKDGSQIMIEDVASPVKDRSGRLTGAVLVFRDHREKFEKQRQIEYLSFHDHLTGLYNRRYMEDALRRLDTLRNFPLTIMVLDVNGLKLTNDAFGHDTGDQLLIHISDILKSVCRSDDLIGRIGGDEFMILFPNTDQESAQQIKDRINQQANKEKLGSVIVSVAIGFAIKNDPTVQIHTVQQQADNSMYKDKIQHGKSMKTGTIKAVLEDIYKQYENEQQHIQNVTEYCQVMAEVLKFSPSETELIKSGAMLHDVGKILIPPTILNKSSAFTLEELEIVQRHPETSYQILKSVDDFAAIAEIVLHHHERWDGKGYPRGLEGESIPVMSRIMSIADAYDAITSHRNYRAGRSKEDAINELKRCKGTQFDPHLVDVFIEQVLPILG